MRDGPWQTGRIDRKERKVGAGLNPASYNFVFYAFFAVIDIAFLACYANFAVAVIETLPS